MWEVWVGIIVFSVFILLSALHLLTVAGLPLLEDSINRILAFRSRVSSRMRDNSLPPPDA